MPDATDTANAALLAVLIDRLEATQSGPRATGRNGLTVAHLRAAAEQLAALAAERRRTRAA